MIIEFKKARKETDDLEVLASVVTHYFEVFKRDCYMIIANRRHDELGDVQGKVYTRDLYGAN